MGTLSYVNVFARDIEALSVFYRDLFGFKEIPEIRSPIFRGLDTGRSCIGFNALDAYELLKLNDNGQITIPSKLRNQIGLEKGSFVSVELIKSMLQRLRVPSKLVQMNW